MKQFIAIAFLLIGTTSFENGVKAPVMLKKNITKTNILTDELLYIRNHD